MSCYQIPEVGQIFRAPSGLLRVVRHVNLSPKWRKYPGRIAVYFVIKHCSWTHRCYTIYTLQDLRRMGYVLTRKWLKNLGKLHRKIEQECAMKVAMPPIITCCDVENIS